MDLQQSSSTSIRYSTAKSKLSCKIPPAPPPRKSSVPNVLNKVCPSHGQKVERKLPPILPKSKPIKENELVEHFVPHPPPPSTVLVPTTSTTSIANQVTQGAQYDIHGVAIMDHVLPIPVSAPHRPPKDPHGRGNLSPTRTTESITLKHLANYHFPKFPLCVQIIEGYMSSHVPHLTFSTEDVYNIHLLKRQEVVVAKDSLGHQYNIPLNTAIKFGLLPSSNVIPSHGSYNPESNAVLTFNKVSDITTMKVLPKVICATKVDKGDEEKGSVELGEIFAIKKVSKCKKKKVLEVFSITKRMQKMLHYDCTGHFTTSPQQIAIHLPELLEHVLDLLPCHVLLFFDEDSMNRKSNFSSTSLSNGVILLTEKKVETSLVASTVLDDVELDLESNDCLLDIPLDDNLSQIEVKIVTSSDTRSRRRLQTATQNILKNVNLSKLRSFRDAVSDNIYETQTMLYSTHFAENDRVGVEFETPWELAQESTSSQGETSCIETFLQNNEASDDQLYETIPASVNKPSSSLQFQSSHCLSSKADIEDNVFINECEPTSNDDLYQIPRSHPATCQPVLYDYPPSHSDLLQCEERCSTSDTTKLSSSLNLQNNKVDLPGKDSLGCNDLLPSEHMLTSNLSRLPDDLKHEVNSAPRTTNKAMFDLDKKINTLQKEHKLLSEKIAFLEQSTLQQVVERIDHLEKHVACHMDTLQPTYGKRDDVCSTNIGDPALKSVPELRYTCNRQLLQRASCDEILHVLESMGLHQYKEAFVRESIDGAILIELSEEILSSELGVKSKIHCVKLNKLISGEYSIQQFL